MMLEDQSRKDVRKPKSSLLDSELAARMGEPCSKQEKQHKWQRKCQNTELIFREFHNVGELIIGDLS